MRSWIGRASVVAAFIAAFGACMARAQPCGPQSCPTDRGDDVAFEITVEYYDWDPFFGGENLTGIWGPRINQIASTPRNVTTGPRIQSTDVGGSVSGGSLFADFTNTAFVNARRIDGHIFGNGARLRAGVYIKGPPGTPYYAIRSARGSLSANFPQGLGRADSFFGSFAASSVNGAGLSQTTLGSDVDGDGMVEDREFDLNVTRGTTSNTQLLIQGVPYTLATEIIFDMHGGVLQSLDFCFPFTPCNAMDYRAAGTASVAIDAGIGNPQCAGTLSLKRNGCTTVPAGPNDPPGTLSQFEHFEIFARFENTGGALCECCRYEQFVRAIETYEVKDGKNCPVGHPLGGPDPCDPNQQQSKQGCCPAEDTLCPNALDCWQSGCCALLEYGDRARAVTAPCPFLQYDGYSDPNGAANQSYGCVYHSIDEPGFHDVESALQGTYRYKAEFIGRIVSICPGDSGRVIAERRWTVDCGLPPSEGVDPGRVALSHRVIQGRDATFAVANDGVNTVFGTLRITAMPSEAFFANDLTVQVMNATSSPPTPERLLKFADGLRTSWVVPFVATFSAGLPNSVTLNVNGPGWSDSAIVSLLAGDIDGDGDVDSADLGILLANWDTTVPVGRLGDLDGNGFVDPADLGILLADWP
ncbi:MAG: hypothetical protein U1D55_03885 [Phycisphaerae bacterium]